MENENERHKQYAFKTKRMQFTQAIVLDKMNDAPALKIMETQFPDTMEATKKNVVT